MGMGRPPARGCAPSRRGAAVGLRAAARLTLPVVPLLAALLTLGLALHASRATAEPHEMSFGSRPTSVAELRDEARRVRGEIVRLDRRVAEAVERYDHVAAELDALTVELLAARSELTRRESELERARQLLALRSRLMYKGGELGLLDIVFSGEDFAEVKRQVDYYRLLTQVDDESIATMEELTARVVTLTGSVEVRRQQAHEKELQLREEQELVEDELARRRAVLRDIDARIRRILRREAREAAAAAERLAEAAGVNLGMIEGTPAQLAVVREALRWVGKPYVWAAADPAVGFDCSGLVMYAYAKFGVELPHGATLQSRLGRPVPLAALRPADLVFFGTPSFYHHVGMYVGGGLFVEARGHAYGVVVSKLAGRGVAFACRYDPRLR
jgi:cell wall-associated NlpC family hydrolase